MAAFLAAGDSGKFSWGVIDHATSVSDVNGDGDIVLPRDGVYSVSASVFGTFDSAPTSGNVIAEIQADGNAVTSLFLGAPAPNLTVGANPSRAGVNLLAGAVITLFIYNNTDVEIDFFADFRNHMDASYEDVASLLP